MSFWCFWNLAGFETWHCCHISVSTKIALRFNTWPFPFSHIHLLKISYSIFLLWHRLTDRERLRKLQPTCGGEGRPSFLEMSLLKNPAQKHFNKEALTDHISLWRIVQRLSVHLTARNLRKPHTVYTTYVHTCTYLCSLSLSDKVYVINIKVCQTDPLR